MKIIPMALLALTLSGGVALAEPGRWRDTSDRSGGTVVTPTHRGDRSYNRRYESPRGHHPNRVTNVQRTRPTFRNNRFYFAGGHYQQYQRPVIQYRYRNYAQRPAVIAEHMQPVSGYVWSAGNWEWDGAEWHWVPGHYEVDATHQQSYNNPNYDNYDNNYDSYDSYDSSDYDNSYQAPVYNNTYRQPTYYQAPTVQGGVQVQGSWNF